MQIPGAWQVASSAWQWKERAAAWDEHIQAELIAKEEARQREILSTGYAVMANRVQALNQLAEILTQESVTYDRRYLADVKSIGAGPLAERVDLERFNSGLLEQTRGVLDDIAKELGDRRKNMDITTNGQQVNQSTVVVLPQKDILE